MQGTYVHRINCKSIVEFFDAPRHFCPLAFWPCQVLVEEITVSYILIKTAVRLKTLMSC